MPGLKSEGSFEIFPMQCTILCVNRFTANEIPTINKQDDTQSSPYTITHVNSDPGFNVAGSNNEEQLQQQQLLRSQSDIFNEQTHPEFDVQPSADRIPFSSYNSEDHTPFSWVNVTG